MLISGAGSEIREIHDEGDSYLEVFRNCSCGTTLMELFNSRRDLSFEGIRKREGFSLLLSSLCKSGMEPDVARAFLLEFVSLMAGSRENNS